MPELNKPSPSLEIRFAKLVSAIFNPLLVPTYAFIILFNIQAYFSLLLSMNAKMLILSIVFINTFIFPLLLLIILKKSGMVSSYSLVNRQDRIYPLIASSILFYITYFLFKRLNIPSVYLIFMLGGAFSSVVALLITYYYKISVHMMALGGLLGAMLSISLNLALHNTAIIAIIIIISGITGTSRILLDAHKSHQVYAGFITGFLIMFLAFKLL